MQKTNARVIAATNQNLSELISKNHFREDLFYRLNTLELEVPPLRERKEDIPELANFFLQRAAEEERRPGCKLAKPAMQLLINYDWPGNIRQLKAIIERLCILSDDRFITAQQVHLELYKEDDPENELSYRKAMEHSERKYIRETLIAHDWNMSKTAESMEIDRTNLYKKMQRLGIKKG